VCVHVVQFSGGARGGGDVNGGGGDGSGGGSGGGVSEDSIATFHAAAGAALGSSRTTPGQRGPFGGAGGAGAEASSGGAVGGAAKAGTGGADGEGIEAAEGEDQSDDDKPLRPRLLPKKPAAKETPKQKPSAAQKPEKRKAKSKPSSSDIPNIVYLLILVFCHLSYLKI
jgi:hypothetical protein